MVFLGMGGGIGEEGGDADKGFCLIHPEGRQIVQRKARLPTAGEPDDARAAPKLFRNGGKGVFRPMGLP